MAKPLDLSIIIPVAPGADPGPAMRAVADDLPRGVTAEIITVAGIHPTRQRNLAAIRARGEVLYFVDHDSLIQPGTTGRLLSAIRSGASVSGGPNLAQHSESRFAKAAGDAICDSWGVRARYSGLGVRRRATELDLILCNLMVKRADFLAVGLFDPRLYPNEENEFLNRLLARGGSAIYDPQAGVRKPRPPSLFAFIRESFRYGRGRLEQIWINPFLRDGLFLAALGGGWLAASRMATLGGLVAVSATLAALVLHRLLVDASALGSLGLSLIRYTSYFLGMSWGAATGWLGRRLRLVPSRVLFSRFSVSRMLPPRVAEEHVFNIGSWSKEVPASA